MPIILNLVLRTESVSCKSSKWLLIEARLVSMNEALILISMWKSKGYTNLSTPTESDKGGIVMKVRLKQKRRIIL